ncbi:MAG TPA: amino acid ABC transporter permease [Candidatus Binatia bacterium]|nr:amino acid ABC transporter permease [Candidatus Binatia bacterium]
MLDAGASGAGAIPPLAPRRSRLGIGGTGTKAILIAALSTVVFFGGLTLIVINAPGWAQVQRSFFNGEVFVESIPRIVRGFGTNVRLFLIAEVLILAWGLVLAVLRSTPGPVFFPVRVLATFYVDLFRALPGLLVIYVLGFGVPALQIEGVPNDRFFWAVVALTLLYSAYVSEVYRAGIESIHPSQMAAARSLGLTQLQSMRHVVVPQAIRRVIPPLLNDFIGLQKDTVLVSFIGVVEVFRAAQIESSARFNFTPFLVVALIFLVVTLPLARLTDMLVAREQRRRAAGFR